MAAVALRQQLAYGLMGLPLAFAALPLYVQWPAHAAQAWGLPLAGLGLLLLAVRLADALVDPWVGRWVDRAHARAPARVWWLVGGAALLLVAGVAALVRAPAWVQGATLWAWAAAALVATSLGYSLGQIAHQSWAARLGGGVAEQARWAGAREACALAGVLLASVLPTALGWGPMPLVLGLLLLLGWAALRRAPMAMGAASGARTEAGGSAWRHAGFRRLMAVYLINGLASAWPAALVLWFMRDRLQAPPWAEGALLALYFAAAALSVPLWAAAVARLGAVPAWALGMALAVAAFVGVVSLGEGDLVGFAVVCAGTGLALGADLVAPAALLARQAGAAGAAGAWFGWWTAAGKLNLALAAGLALPLLQWAGFVPGQRDAASLQALAWAYAVVPCVLKLAALALLWRVRPHLQDQAPAAAPRRELPCLP